MIRTIERGDPTQRQSFGSVFIWYGYGSSILGWIPIWFRIRIQSGSRVFLTKNSTKFKAEKKFFWIKNKIYLSLGLHKGLLSYKRSLQLSKGNIQHFKVWNFIIFFYLSGLFLPSWIRIRIWIPNTDPDPNLLTWLNPDPKPCSTLFSFQGATALSGWTRSRCLTWLARKKITWTRARPRVSWSSFGNRKGCPFNFLQCKQCWKF